MRRSVANCTPGQKDQDCSRQTGIIRYAADLPPFTETLAELRSTAAAAVQEAKKITPIRNRTTPELQVGFLKAEQAECAVPSDSTRTMRSLSVIDWRTYDLYPQILLWFLSGQNLHL
jgi:D-aminopeptidase